VVFAARCFRLGIMNASIANYTAHANASLAGEWRYERVLNEFDMDSIIVFVVFLALLIATLLCIQLVTPKNRYTRLHGTTTPEYGAGNDNNIEMQNMEPLTKTPPSLNGRTDEEVASASV